MVSTFPAIGFGLMVGIGGGIPPRVRLGDVVVGVPTDQYPGVIQWGFRHGRTERQVETNWGAEQSACPAYRVDDTGDGV